MSLFGRDPHVAFRLFLRVWSSFGDAVSKTFSKKNFLLKSYGIIPTEFQRNTTNFSSTDIQVLS